MMMKKNIIYSLIISSLCLSAMAVEVTIPESKCSNIDARDNMAPELRDHFSSPQDQDSIGWCYGFTAADLLSAETGTPVSSFHTSAIFNRNIENSFFMNIGYKIGNLFMNNRFEDVYEGGWITSAAEDAIENARVCSEAALPFDNNWRGEIRMLVSRLEELKNAYDEESLNTEAICPAVESLRVDYGINISAMSLYSNLEQNNMNTILANLVEEHCSENMIELEDIEIKKMSTPRERRTGIGSKSSARRANDLSRRVNRYFDTIDEVLTSGKPIGVSYNVRHITPFSGGHASTLMARRWNNGKCEFKIRNSWGESCDSYDFSEISECDENEGSFWVSDQTFYEMVSDINFVE